MSGGTLRADPLADATIARILGPCMAADTSPQLASIAIVNREIAAWDNNGKLATWRASPGVPAPIADALHDFVAAASILPDWADAALVERAEHVFMDIGMMSCTLLFCASLPECYVVPDLAAVLHAAGQLDNHCEYRIRATAAMIFPVMMRGGLMTAAGAGVAQTMKVRLIHATIRYLILHGAVDADPAAIPAPVTGRPLPPAPDGAQPNMQQQLLANGWRPARDGLPCNQDELAYTLLTFSYVYLRGLRKLGLALPPGDELAFLHAWNVVGHLLGIERDLMPASMNQAAAMFGRLQAQGRNHPYTPDPRPALADALMRTMQNDIPFRLLKPFPVLFTRHLCGSASATDLGLTSPVSWISGALFAILMGTVRLVDATVRLVLPQFSFSRLLARVVGYRFTVRILMDQTRPLKLPDALLGQVDGVLSGWTTDPKAPTWMNRLERRIARPTRPPDQPLGGAA